MKKEKIPLYKSIKSYFVVEEMKNEVTMWYVASGLLAQFLNIQKGHLPFGGLKSNIGFLNNFSSTEILDICSGPGTLINHLSAVVKDIKGVCLDLDDAFIAYGNKHYKKWNFIKGDAVSVNLKMKFSIIVLSSGYHHIPDNKKVALLKNIKRHLTRNGIVIICDNFILNYASDSKRKRSVYRYYSALKKYFRDGNGTSKALSFLDNVENRDLRREDEYKVSFQIFEKHIVQAGLCIDQDVKVWQPKKFQKDNAGSHVIILKKLSW